MTQEQIKSLQHELAAARAAAEKWERDARGWQGVAVELKAEVDRMFRAITSMSRVVQR